MVFSGDRITQTQGLPCSPLDAAPEGWDFPFTNDQLFLAMYCIIFIGKVTELKFTKAHTVKKK